MITQIPQLLQMVDKSCSCAHCEKLVRVARRALEVADYYADNENWFCSQDMKYGDLITVSDMAVHPDSKRVLVGGKRARDFLTWLKKGDF